MFEMPMHLKGHCCTQLRCRQGLLSTGRRPFQHHKTVDVSKLGCRCSSNKQEFDPLKKRPATQTQKPSKPTDSQPSPKQDPKEPDRQTLVPPEAFKAAMLMAQRASDRQKHPFKYDLKHLAPTIPLLLGLPGTLAVVAGYLLHIDPFGNLHWSLADAVTGLTWAAPLLALDACLMLPSFESSAFQRGQKIAKARRGLAKAKQSVKMQQGAPPTSSSAVGADPIQPDNKAVLEAELRDLKQIVRSMMDSSMQKESSQASSNDSKSSSHSDTPDRQKDSSNANTSAASTSQRTALEDFEVLMEKVNDQIHRKVQSTPVSLPDALSRWQREVVSRDPYQKHLLVSELVCVLLEQLPYHMLERAVWQTALAGWLLDRFYEAGMEDTMPLIGHQALPTPQAAQWTAIAILVGLYAGRRLPGLLRPRKPIEVLGLGKDGKAQSTSEAAIKTLSQEKQKTLRRLQQMVDQQSLVSSSIVILRSTVAAVLYGGSFIATGNLLAPCVASAARRVVLSLEHRLKHRRHFMGLQEQMQLLQRVPEPAFGKSED